VVKPTDERLYDIMEDGAGVEMFHMRCILCSILRDLFTENAMFAIDSPAIKLE
jgi:hypothetical protein